MNYCTESRDMPKKTLIEYSLSIDGKLQKKSMPHALPAVNLRRTSNWFVTASRNVGWNDPKKYGQHFKGKGNCTRSMQRNDIVGKYLPTTAAPALKNCQFETVYLGIEHK